MESKKSSITVAGNSNPVGNIPKTECCECNATIDRIYGNLLPGGCDFLFMCQECRIQLDLPNSAEYFQDIIDSYGPAPGQSGTPDMIFKSLRQQAGYTIKRLARRWNLSERRISQIQNDPSEFHLDAIRWIARVHNQEH
jgi:hypothetical protein